MSIFLECESVDFSTLQNGPDVPITGHFACIDCYGLMPSDSASELELELKELLQLKSDEFSSRSDMRKLTAMLGDGEGGGAGIDAGGGQLDTEAAAGAPRRRRSPCSCPTPGRCGVIDLDTTICIHAHTYTHRHTHTAHARTHTHTHTRAHLHPALRTRSLRWTSSGSTGEHPSTPHATWADMGKSGFIEFCPPLLFLLLLLILFLCSLPLCPHTIVLSGPYTLVIAPSPPH